jgi:hypothetical protein
MNMAALGTAQPRRKSGNSDLLVDIVPGLLTAIGVARATDPNCVYYVVGALVGVFYLLYVWAYKSTRLFIVGATLLFVHQITSLLHCANEGGNPYAVAASILVSPALLFRSRYTGTWWNVLSVVATVCVVIVHGLELRHPHTLQIVAFVSYLLFVVLSFV